jgi:predicted O-methyltransferase YrrM
MTEELKEMILAELAHLPRVRWRVGGEVFGDEPLHSKGITGLIDLCREYVKPHFKVAEIGCYAGISTEVFALFARKVMAIDPWENAGKGGYTELPSECLKVARDRFLMRMEGYPNVEWFQLSSETAARNAWDESYDMVYIDGDHRLESFIKDVKLWMPKLKPDGFLAGHDYRRISGGWSRAGLPDPLQLFDDQSWIVRGKDVRR